MAIPYARQKTWVNNTSQQVDDAWLNAVEDTLVKAMGIAPLTNGALIWDGTQFRADAKITASNITAATITNAEIAAGAAIAKSKLAALNIADADVVAGAAIGIAKLAGYPTDATKFLRGDATWAVPPAPTSYRKTTSKTVNTTVAATDLLNGEITIAAGVMGATGVLRLTAWGDWLQNIGTNQVPPRFQVLLGGTTMIDTNTQGGGVASSATRQPWRLSITILNLTTNSQIVYIEGTLQSGANTAGVAAFTTGTGQYQPLGTSFLLQGNNTGLAVDTTASRLLALNVINGNAGAAYETKLLGALVEII